MKKIIAFCMLFILAAAMLVSCKTSAAGKPDDGTSSKAETTEPTPATTDSSVTDPKGTIKISNTKTRCIVDLDFTKETDCNVTINLEIPDDAVLEDPADTNSYIYLRYSNEYKMNIPMIKIFPLSKITKDFTFDENLCEYYKPDAAHYDRLKNYSAKTGRTTVNGYDYVIYDLYEGSRYSAFAFVRLNDEYIIGLNFEGGMLTEAEAINIVNSTTLG
mgnify:CR=1 FL=1